MEIIAITETPGFFKEKKTTFYEVLVKTLNLPDILVLGTI